MSRASDFFYKFQGIPLSVGTELGVSLGGPQACMPHQLADGVQRDIMFTAFVKVWVKALGRI